MSGGRGVLYTEVPCLGLGTAMRRSPYSEVPCLVGMHGHSLSMSSGVHMRIGSSLLGSYVCFTKWVWIQLTCIYCWDYVQLVKYQTNATGCELTLQLTSRTDPWLLCSYTVLCKTLNTCLWQISLAGDSESLIGHPTVTFSGAPNFTVADSLDGA